METHSLAKERMEEDEGVFLFRSSKRPALAPEVVVREARTYRKGKVVYDSDDESVQAKKRRRLLEAAVTIAPGLSSHSIFVQNSVLLAADGSAAPAPGGGGGQGHNKHGRGKTEGGGKEPAPGSTLPGEASVLKVLAGLGSSPCATSHRRIDPRDAERIIKGYTVEQAKELGIPSDEEGGPKQGLKPAAVASASASFSASSAASLSAKAVPPSRTPKISAPGTARGANPAGPLVTANPGAPMGKANAPSHGPGRAQGNTPGKTPGKTRGKSQGDDAEYKHHQHLDDDDNHNVSAGEEPEGNETDLVHEGVDTRTAEEKVRDECIRAAKKAKALAKKAKKRQGPAQNEQ